MLPKEWVNRSSWFDGNYEEEVSNWGISGFQVGF